MEKMKNPFKRIIHYVIISLIICGILGGFSAVGWAVNNSAYTWGNIKPSEVNKNTLTILKRYYTIPQLASLKGIEKKKVIVSTGPFTERHEWFVKLRGGQGVTSCIFFWVAGHGVNRDALYSNFYKPCNIKRNPISHIFPSW